jgi:hypothetical protein
MPDGNTVGSIMLVGGERITLLQVGVLRVVEHWTKFPEQL